MRTKKNSSHPLVKKVFILFILLSAGLIPWACSDNNSAPTKPPGPTLAVATNTPTGTQTPGTPTFTFTPVPGANTPTFTPTFVLPTPAFQYNYSTSASPSQLVINPAGGGYILAAAESQSTIHGGVIGVEGFSTGAGGTLNPPSYTGELFQGFPTPGSTPQWQPVTTGLQGPQGFVNPGGANGYAAILDAIPGGGANLYVGYSYAPVSPYNGWKDYSFGYFWEPKSVNGYGGIIFNNPKGLAADANTNVYVADTGNGFVEEFFPAIDYGLTIEHFWNGYSGVTVGGTGSVFNQPTSFFKSPTAITCDPLGNVWVSDTGFSPSVVQEYTGNATTILQSWSAIPGSIVSGLTVDNSVNCAGGPCVFVADTGAHVVEVYSKTGTLMTEMTNPYPSSHEGQPFAPTCIAIANIGGTNYLYVGDANNNFIDVFK